MYIILVNEDNTLIATNKERIMQRSKLVDTLCFLVAPNYKNHNMAVFTVLLEYVLPASRKYCSEILTLSTETYNGHLKYSLPLDTNLTSEPGEIELQLTFASTYIDANGNPIQLVRKTSAISVNITPISAWSDIIPDSALSAIDQRLIKADAQIKALEDIGEIIMDTKADNIRYDTKTSELQLVAGNKAIGNKITIVSCEDSDDSNDCVAVVEF